MREEEGVRHAGSLQWLFLIALCSDVHLQLNTDGLTVTRSMYCWWTTSIVPAVRSSWLMITRYLSPPTTYTVPTSLLPATLSTALTLPFSPSGDPTLYTSPALLSLVVKPWPKACVNPFWWWSKRSVEGS